MIELNTLGPQMSQMRDIRQRTGGSAWGPWQRHTGVGNIHTERVLEAWERDEITDEQCIEALSS